MTNKASALFLLLSTACSFGFSKLGTVYTTDGSQSDVQAAIDDASANDTVGIPAGTFVWSTTGDGVLVDAIDGIIVRGAGIDQTIIDDRTDGTAAQAVFRFSNYHVGNKSFRITGITINHHATLYASAAIYTSAPSCVIDNVKITEVVTRGIFVASTQGDNPMAKALIHNCEIRGRSTDGVSQLITVNGNDYGNPPSVASGTQGSWYLDVGLGGSEATFIENSILYNSNNQDSTIETYSGGKVVVRNSTLTNFVVGAHGNDSSTRSGHSIEVYDNTITQTLGSDIPAEINVRGGTALSHGNTITESGMGTTAPMKLQVYRAAGFNLTNGNPFLLALSTPAGSFVTGRSYSITVAGTTDFTAIGAASNTVGTIFTATGAGTGTGKASNRLYVGRYDYNTGNDRYERDGYEATIYFAYTGGQWRLYGDGLHQLTHSDDGRQDQVVGTYEASGSGDIVLASSVTNQGLVRIYNNDLLNGAELSDGNTAVTGGSGTHTGSSGVATLTDSTKSWTTNEHLGNGTAAFDDELFAYYIWNLTSGAGGFVTANDATTVTAALNGGTRQTWTTGDTYVITNGYPGLDQPGWAGPTRFSATYSTQVLTPCRVWDNTYNGSPDVRVFDISWDGDYDSTNSPRISEFIQEGREYYNNAGAPPGYTPYTYPHPLRGIEMNATNANVTTLDVTP